ncbi:hypothetical protein F7P83_09140 [Brevibacterium luteolum]|nr:hypothetical protein [Brevibacterium luteolum]
MQILTTARLRQDPTARPHECCAGAGLDLPYMEDGGFEVYEPEDAGVDTTMALAFHPEGEHQMGLPHNGDGSAMQVGITANAEVSDP